MAMDKVTKWGLVITGLGFLGSALAVALTPRPGAERDLRGAPGHTPGPKPCPHCGGHGKVGGCPHCGGKHAGHDHGAHAGHNHGPNDGHKHG